MKGIIYEYYNSISNRYYIGQTAWSLKKRHSSHLHSKGRTSWFDNSLRKHPEQFVSRVLYEVEASTKESLRILLNELEASTISKYIEEEKQLYNLAPGGIGYIKFGTLSPEEKREHQRLATAKWRANHPEENLEAYRIQNLKRKEYQAQWQKDHREQRRESVKKYQAKKKLEKLQQA